MGVHVLYGCDIKSSLRLHWVFLQQCTQKCPAAGSEAALLFFPVFVSALDVAIKLSDRRGAVDSYKAAPDSYMDYS